MNNNNTSAGAMSLQESWATHISDYILQRRQQTQAAYANTEQAHVMMAQDNQPLLSPSSDLPNNKALFSAFFILLANQLEEGHTVLTLSQGDDDAPHVGQVNNQSSKLYDWQIKLLELLIAPLVDFIETESIESVMSGLNIDTPSIFDQLSVIFTKKQQLWRQASLDAAQRQMLTQRLNLVLNVYNQLNQCHLASLIQHIQNHPLFTKMSMAHGNNEVHVEHQNSLSSSKVKQETTQESTHTTSIQPNQAQQAETSKAISHQTPIIFNVDLKHGDDNQQSTHNQTRLTLWLHRAWQAEYNLAQKINQILANSVTPLDITIPDHLNQQQVNAINVANNNAFSIITGGPGTGKTYTVAQLVMALQQAQDEGEGSSDNRSAEQIRFSSDSETLALAAPTGKAAQRMQESLQAALDAANVDMQLQEAKTIHRLLGIGRTGKPRYHADNPLGEDIIIVDEASMLGVELANYLVSAVKPGARLILLGDANQLAAVDAGAVLADLCRIPLLSPIHAQLTESRRFSKDSGIGKLAHQINQDSVNHSTIWELLREDKALSFENINAHSEVYSETSSGLDVADNKDLLIDNKIINSLSNKKQISKLLHFYQNYVNQTRYLLQNPIATSVPEEVKETISSLMAVFNQFRVLSAGHHGQWGDHFINQYLTQWHTAELKLPIRQDAWYHGRPVMVLQNNYELGLFNGDIGICLQTAGKQAGKQGGLEVFFENKSQGIAVNLLNEELVATAYAMTIHKSQGSEFDHVAITMDNSHARLLSKELIYTAVTRAKKQVTVYSSKQAFDTAVATPTQRHTGLALQFG